MSSCHYLTEVKDLKLGIPKAVESYAKEYNRKGYKPYDNKTTFSYIQKIGKRFICRTFAVRRLKNGKYELGEVRRQVANEWPYVCNSEYKWMGGWCFDYCEWNAEESYKYWGEKRNGGCWIGPVINQDEIIEKHFPYCAWYEAECNITFWEYIEHYIKNPKLELLCKAGYSSLTTCLRYLDIQAKSLDKILKVKPQWVEYLKGKGYYDLMACRKPYCKTVKDVELVADTMHNNEAWTTLKYCPKGKELRMCDYLHKQAFFRTRMYRDYLDIAGKLGMPLEENKVLFPDDLVQAHDQAAEKFEIIKNEEKNAEIKKHLKNLLKYIYEDDKYLIRPAESVEDLIEESKQMKNCVRTYADKYSKGLTAIFFIRQITNPDKSFVTLELKGNSVSQCLAYHNSKPTDEVLEFVKKWKKEKLNDTERKSV